MQHNYVDNLIVFPRQYEINRANEDFSVCRGVDQAGNAVSVRVHLSPEDKKKRDANPKLVYPSIAQISKGNAKRAGCLISDDNGPDNRTGGVLMFERVARDSDGTYVARWASVLAHGTFDKDPRYGVGYIEAYGVASMDRGDVVKESTAVRVALHDALIKLRGAITTGDTEGMQRARVNVAHLTARHDELVRYRFRATLIHSDQARTYRVSNIQRLENKLVNVIDQYSANGHLGGAWLRVRDLASNAVLYAQSASIHTRYNLQTRSVTHPVDEVRGFLREPAGGNLLSLDYRKVELDIIPVSRISYAQNANEENNAEAKLEDIRAAFLNPVDLSPIARPIAIRTIDASPGAQARSDDTHSEMAARTLPIGAALGHPLLLDNDFTPSLRFSHDPAPTIQRIHRRLAPGERYTIDLPDGERAIATCRQNRETRSIGLYVGRTEINDYTLIGLAPDAQMKVGR